jgi:hypothetical protein
MGIFCLMGEMEVSMLVKTKKNEVMDLQLQQYAVGLYVVLYKQGRVYAQFCLDVLKEQFLNDLESGKLGLVKMN